MKKKLSAILFGLFMSATIFIASPCTARVAKADEEVYLGGFAAGFSIESRGADIVGLSDVITENGIVSPAKNAGIMAGDKLMSVDATEINCSRDVEKALENFSGDKVVVIVRRDGESLIKDVYPAKEIGGSYKLGLFIRDNLSGIGTMTFIKGDGEFMALGHPICEKGAEPSDIIGGSIFECSIIGVNKGEKGAAGELKGVFRRDKAIGSVNANLEEGIRGKIFVGFDKSKLSKVETDKAKPGQAVMVTTIDGSAPREYTISIVKVDDGAGKRTKNLVIKVTDDTLIREAGGIVQGMSGSPILQNGKLVGAVTHVFVNDPTRGYGISIENMLDAK